MSVYLNNIPQASDRLSVSQGQFLVNFGQLNTQFGIDHVPFRTIGGANGSGFHNQVTLAADVASPSIVGAVGSVHANSVGANHELFYKNASRDMQISNSVFQTYTPTITPNNGSFTGLTINGYFVVIGGVTFFTINASYSGTAGNPSAITASLPTTCLSTGGQAYFATRGLTAVITATASSISFPVGGPFLGAGSLFVNGFYI